MKFFVTAAALLSAPLAFAVSIAERAAPLDQLVGFGAGTTGGGNASPQTVTSCSALKTAVGATGAAVIKVSGTLTSCGIMDVKSDKTIIGIGSSAGLTDSGFRIKKQNNVIIRNLKFNTPTGGGDIITVEASTKVWIDHNELFSKGLTGGKDDYDGLLDITHGSDYVTVSWNIFRDHWKGSLIGHSDDNGSEDTGHLRVTYHHNLWSNVNSRLPSLRFGTGHVYNSVFKNCPTSGINSRMGAQVLVESNVFNNVRLAIVTNLDSEGAGYATDKNNVKTSSTTSITQTASWTPSYSYTLDSTSSLESIVNSGAGVGKIA